MPIELITGPANAGKAELVMAELRAENGRGRRPLLVVPTAADVEHYTRELCLEGALMGAQVVTFGGLARELVGRAGVGGRQLGPVARRRILERLGSRLTGGRRPGAGFIQALEELFAELQARRVTPARLQAALAAAAAAAPGATLPDGLGAAYGSYRGALERLGVSDGEQQVVAALDELRRNPWRWGETPVLFYGFDDLTRLQVDAIETLGAIVDAPVTVSLAYEAGRVAFAGRAGSREELVPLARSEKALPARDQHYAPGARATLAHLERSLFEPAAPRRPAGSALRLLEAGDERAELELVAAEIQGLLGEGMAAEEIAVVMRRFEGRGALVAEVFAAAGVPFALEPRRRFADTALGAGLIGLLRCVPDSEGEAVGGPADLLAWLRSPGLLQRRGDGGLDLADRLEQEARRGGVRDLAGARALWESHNWKLEEIDRLATAQARGPLALCEQAERSLQRLFAVPRRSQAAVLEPSELEQAEALATGRRALAELRELAGAGRELAPQTAGELAASLRELQLRRAGAGGGVAVLEALSLRARRVRALFVVGLQEGRFPEPAGSSGVLGERQRRLLAQAGGLLLELPREQLPAERYLFYALLSRPQELLVLSWHLADDRGEPISRSLFVEDVLDLYDEELGGRVRKGSPRGQEAFAARASPPVEGVSDPDLLAELSGRVWSASSLEGWLQCPMRWLIDRQLSPRLMQPDAEPLAKGHLAHEALNTTLLRLREQTGSARIRPAVLELARELMSEALAAAEAEYRLAIAPERAIGLRRRLQADLERYLRRAAECEDELEPSELELAFGFDRPDPDAGEHEGPGDGEGGLPAADLGGGLLLRGRIDRVDTGRDGEAVVIDYKSSYRSDQHGSNWIEDGHLQLALYMRAFEQLRGGRAIGGLYQPLSGRSISPRGVLDAEAETTVECARNDAMDSEQVQAIVEAALELARGVVREAAAGAVESRPETCNSGYGCPYPAICRRER